MFAFFIGCSDDNNGSNNKGNNNGGNPCTTCGCGADPCDCGTPCPPTDGPPLLTAAQLGLTNGETGNAIVTAMNNRWSNAQTIEPTLFYDFDANPLYTGSDTDYNPPVSFKYASVYDMDPRIGFFVKGDYLVVWGRTESSNHNIDFDVAVIRNSGPDAGKGWVKTIPNKSYGTILTRSTHSISSLTGNYLANEAALGTDYNVYIIVKRTSRITTATGNVNAIIDALADRNVIQAYPTPY